VCFFFFNIPEIVNVSNIPSSVYHAKLVTNVDLNNNNNNTEIMDINGRESIIGLPLPPSPKTLSKISTEHAKIDDNNSKFKYPRLAKDNIYVNNNPLHVNNST
jgi:hypothetical protein